MMSEQLFGCLARMRVLVANPGHHLRSSAKHSLIGLSQAGTCGVPHFTSCCWSAVSRPSMGRNVFARDMNKVRQSFVPMSV